MKKPKLYQALRKELFGADFTQEYLAQKLECSTDHIGNMLGGKSPWRLNYCYQILDMLNKPYTDLPKYFPPNGLQGGDI